MRLRHELAAFGPERERLFLPAPTDDSLMPRSIDASLFDGHGPDVRSFVLDAVIHAPVSEVYAAWTDGAVFPVAFAPDRPELAAHIDLAIGGRFEWLWDGEVGSNGCQVLSYIPDRMLSFSWNAPPTQPESRARRTWVVVEFDPEGEAATRVTLTHLGFGTEAHWDETFDYFGAAWPHVLEQFRRNLERGPGERPAR